VFNLSNGKAKSLQPSGDAWCFFHLEFVLTSEAPLSLRGFFQSVQGNQSISAMGFCCGISLDLSGVSEGYEVANQDFMTE
jgi:hypothetical protein